MAKRKRASSKPTQDLQELIARATRGDNDAIAAFREIGDSAVPHLVAAWRGPIPDGVHGRDFVESITAAISEACRDDATALIELICGDSLPDDPFRWLATCALRASRDPRVNDTLLWLLEHGTNLARQAAAEGLIQRREKRAIEPLLSLMKRSRSMASFLIVTGLRRTPEMQDARAIPILERILTHRSLAPGARREAAELLQLLEQRFRHDRE